VDSDHVTVLDTEIVADNPVDAGAAIIELLISKDNENGVLSLLSADKNSVATEQLQGVHRGL
jgi:hypothetical protein